MTKKLLVFIITGSMLFSIGCSSINNKIENNNKTIAEENKEAGKDSDASKSETDKTVSSSTESITGTYIFNSHETQEKYEVVLKKLDNDDIEVTYTLSSTNEKNNPTNNKKEKASCSTGVLKSVDKNKWRGTVSNGDFNKEWDVDANIIGDKLYFNFTSLRRYEPNGDAKKLVEENKTLKQSLVLTKVSEIAPKKNEVVEKTELSSEAKKAPSEAEKAESEELALRSILSALMKNYTNGYVLAVNNGDFSSIESYLEPNSTIYNLQKDSIKELYKSGIKKEVVGVNIDSFEYDSKKSEGTVTVTEKYNLTSPDGKKKTENFKNKYKFIYDSAKEHLFLKELMNNQ